MAPKRKPAKEKPLRLNALEMRYCMLRMQGKTPEVAVAEMGLDPRQGTTYEQREMVKLYMERYTERFLEGSVTHEVMKLNKAGINRDSIAQRLWFLASLAPHETRESIDGQIDALKTLSELLGYTFDPKTLPNELKHLSEEQLKEYATTGKVN
jgi:hypothetical protein